VFKRMILALLMPSAVMSAASAHSLKELDDQLISKEKYFQQVDIAAPGFAVTAIAGGVYR
jgi:hypothetical protein